MYKVIFNFVYNNNSMQFYTEILLILGTNLSLEINAYPIFPVNNRVYLSLQLIDAIPEQGKIIFYDIQCNEINI